MAVWFGLKEEIQVWEKKQGNIEFLCKWLQVYSKIGKIEEEEIRRKGCFIFMLELPKIRKKWFQMMVVSKRLRIVRSERELVRGIKEIEEWISNTYQKKVKDINLSTIRNKYSLLISECGKEDDIAYFEVYKPILFPQELSIPIPSYGKPSKSIKWNIIEDYPISIIRQTN